MATKTPLLPAICKCENQVGHVVIHIHNEIHFSHSHDGLFEQQSATQKALTRAHQTQTETRKKQLSLETIGCNISKFEFSY